MSFRRLPTQNDELEAVLRRVLERLSALESRPDGRPGSSQEVPFRLGGYTLRVNGAGDLIVKNDETGTTNVIGTP